MYEYNYSVSQFSLLFFDNLQSIWKIITHYWFSPRENKTMYTVPKSIHYLIHSVFKALQNFWKYHDKTVWIFQHVNSFFSRILKNPHSFCRVLKQTWKLFFWNFAIKKNSKKTLKNNKKSLSKALWIQIPIHWMYLTEI